MRAVAKDETENDPFDFHKESDSEPAQAPYIETGAGAERLSTGDVHPKRNPRQLDGAKRREIAWTGRKRNPEQIGTLPIISALFCARGFSLELT